MSPFKPSLGIAPGAPAIPHLIICPGFHPPGDTDQMLSDMANYPSFQALPRWRSPTILAGADLRQSLELSLGSAPGPTLPPLIFLAFSAGCVAAISVARHWQAQGGPVAALIALDGFGVPLVAPFPVHRLSHDRFTHDTSALLGSGSQNFYADPAVPHRRLWQRPSQVGGWQIDRSSGLDRDRHRTTAGACLAAWLATYQG